MHLPSMKSLRYCNLNLSMLSFSHYGMSWLEPRWKGQRLSQDHLPLSCTKLINIFTLHPLTKWVELRILGSYEAKTAKRIWDRIYHKVPINLVNPKWFRNRTAYTEVADKMLGHCSLMIMYLYAKSVIYLSECSKYPWVKWGTKLFVILCFNSVYWVK